MAGAADAAAPAEGLEARLTRVIASPALARSRVSALVVDASSGAVLFDHQGREALMPASTQKLLTALAALHELGPSHRFETVVSAPAALDAEGAVADLYVEGGGDPGLTSELWWRLAADLRAQGLRRVRGDLVLDDRRYDDVRWNPSWGLPVTRAYFPPVAALAANFGAFRTVVRPAARAGAPAEVFVDPPVETLTIVSDAITGPARSSQTLRIDREIGPAGERVRVSGRIPLGSDPVEAWRSVADPVRYAGAVFKLQLEANGIAVGGDLRLGPAPAEADFRYRFQGRALAELVGLLFKFSNNFIAESLFKELGWRADPGLAAGSWESGSRAVGGALADLGIPLGGAQLVDGSGLSRDDRASAALLVDALRTGAATFLIAPEYEAALPIASRDGTLHRRARGAADRLRAKTGTLDGVSALAGYADRASGQRVVFAVIANADPSAGGALAPALDAFAAALVAP